MELMEIRRGLMMSMASGLHYEKGTITPGGYSIITFSKPFERYLFWIEMTDESKQTLENSGVNGNRTYASFAIYPKPVIGEHEETYNSSVFRINPATGSTNQTYTSKVVTDKSIGLSGSNVNNGGTTDLYIGFTYNWFVVELA